MAVIAPGVRADSILNLEYGTSTTISVDMLVYYLDSLTVDRE